jgi:hypothetical protein
VSDKDKSFFLNLGEISEMSDEDALSMPVINPILSAVEEEVKEIITVPGGKEKGEAKGLKDAAVTPDSAVESQTSTQNYIESLESQVHRLKREELRGVILMAIVLNFKDRNIRKRVIESVHTHLLNKHRILEYVVAQKILALSAVKDDIRLLELEKQMVLKQIDDTLELVSRSIKRDDRPEHRKRDREVNRTSKTPK